MMLDYKRGRGVKYQWKRHYAGLSINILCAGNKLPVQEVFSKIGDILPASRFLGGLYTFCNVVNYIFFDVRLDDT